MTPKRCARRWPRCAKRGGSDRLRADDGRAPRRPHGAGRGSAAARATRSSPRSSSTRRSSAPMRTSPPIRAARPPMRTMLEEGGCALLWAPDAATMYPDGFATNVRSPAISDDLDGAARPGHFDGVATVVLEAVRPGPPRRRLVRREGLSAARRDPPHGARPRPCRSRSSASRPSATPTASPCPRATPISATRSGARPAPCRARSARRRARSRRGAPVAEALAAARDKLAEAGFDPIDYVELRDAETLAPASSLDRPARLLAAARIGRTRLIDNLPVGARLIAHAMVIAALTICW